MICNSSEKPETEVNKAEGYLPPIPGETPPPPPVGHQHSLYACVQDYDDPAKMPGPITNDPDSLVDYEKLHSYAEVE